MNLLPSPSLQRSCLTSPPNASILDFTTSRSYTSSGNICNLFCHRETWHKQEIDDFFLAELFCLLPVSPDRVRLLFLLRFLCQYRYRHRLTSMITLFPSWNAFKKMVPTSRLATLFTNFRTLKTMVCRVTEQDAVTDRLIWSTTVRSKLGIFTGHVLIPSSCSDVWISHESYVGTCLQRSQLEPFVLS